MHYNLQCWSEGSTADCVCMYPFYGNGKGCERHGVGTIKWEQLERQAILLAEESASLAWLPLCSTSAA